MSNIISKTADNKTAERYMAAGSLSRLKPRLKAFFGRKVVLFGTIIIICFLIMAIFAPWLAPNDPYKVKISNRMQWPSREYPLGTDTTGRCILSQIIYGARTSLLIGLVVVFCAFTIGGFLGLLAGYLGGTANIVIMRIMDALMAFPQLVLAIFIAGFLGPGVKNVIIALTISLTPSYARLMCGQAMSVKENDYILAARAMGFNKMKIMLSHLLPNCLPPLIVQITMMLGTTILAEAGLSFLGVGIIPPTIAWGYMVSAGQQYLESFPILSFAPELPKKR